MSLTYLGTTLVNKIRDGGAEDKGTLDILNAVVITFNVTPNDATVKCGVGSSTLTVLTGNSIEVAKGMILNYEISKTGYRTITASLTCNADETLNYTLQKGDIQCIFRNLDDDTGTLSLATGAIENVSEFTTIGNYGLAYAFYYCLGLTGNLAFTSLTSIGNYGLDHAFYGCTGISGELRFPELTTIGDSAFANAFDGCTGITKVYFDKLSSIGTNGLKVAFQYCDNISEVHFPSALNGNAQCTTSNMKCTNATVYFDL